MLIIQAFSCKDFNILHICENKVVKLPKNWISSSSASLLRGRVAEVAWGPPPKSLDSDENFKPQHTLFCRGLRFVAIYSLFGDLWAKKVPVWVKNSIFHGIYHKALDPPPLLPLMAFFPSIFHHIFSIPNKRILHLVWVKNITFNSSYNWFKIDILRLLRPPTTI